MHLVRLCALLRIFAVLCICSASDPVLAVGSTTLVESELDVLITAPPNEFPVHVFEMDAAGPDDVLTSISVRIEGNMPDVRNVGLAFLLELADGTTAISEYGTNVPTNFNLFRRLEPARATFVNGNYTLRVLAYRSLSAARTAEDFSFKQIGLRRPGYTTFAMIDVAELTLEYNTSTCSMASPLPTVSSGGGGASRTVTLPAPSGCTGLHHVLVDASDAATLRVSGPGLETFTLDVTGVTSLTLASGAAEEQTVEVASLPSAIESLSVNFQAEDVLLLRGSPLSLAQLEVVAGFVVLDTPVSIVTQGSCHCTITGLRFIRSYSDVSAGDCPVTLRANVDGAEVGPYSGVVFTENTRVETNGALEIFGRSGNSSEVALASGVSMRSTRIAGAAVNITGRVASERFRQAVRLHATNSGMEVHSDGSLTIDGAALHDDSLCLRTRLGNSREFALGVALTVVSHDTTGSIALNAVAGDLRIRGKGCGHAMIVNAGTGGLNLSASDDLVLDLDAFSAGQAMTSSGFNGNEQWQAENVLFDARNVFEGLLWIGSQNLSLNANSDLRVVMPIEEDSSIGFGVFLSNIQSSTIVAGAGISIDLAAGVARLEEYAYSYMTADTGIYVVAGQWISGSGNEIKETLITVLDGNIDIQASKEIAPLSQTGVTVIHAQGTGSININVTSASSNTLFLRQLSENSEGYLVTDNGDISITTFSFDSDTALALLLNANSTVSVRAGGTGKISVAATSTFWDALYISNFSGGRSLVELVTQDGDIEISCTSLVTRHGMILRGKNIDFAIHAGGSGSVRAFGSAVDGTGMFLSALGHINVTTDAGDVEVRGVASVDMDQVYVSQYMYNGELPAGAGIMFSNNFVEAAGFRFEAGAGGSVTVTGESTSDAGILFRGPKFDAHFVTADGNVIMSGTSERTDGIVVRSNGTLALEAGGSGDVRFSGTRLAGPNMMDEFDADEVGDGIDIDKLEGSVRIVTASGDIEITGTTDAPSGSNVFGVSVGASRGGSVSVFAGAPGDITVSGSAGSVGGGVQFAAAAAHSWHAETGNVVISGVGVDAPGVLVSGPLHVAAAGASGLTVSGQSDSDDAVVFSADGVQLSVASGSMVIEGSSSGELGVLFSATDTALVADGAAATVVLRGSDVGFGGTGDALHVQLGSSAVLTLEAAITAGDGEFAVSSGTVIVASDSSAFSGSTAVDGGGVLAGTGKLGGTVSVVGTIAPGSDGTVGCIELGGDVTLDGTLAVDSSSNSACSGTDVLRVGGDFVLERDAQIRVTQSDGTPELDSEITVVQTVGEVDGDFDDEVFLPVNLNVFDRVRERDQTVVVETKKLKDVIKAIGKALRDRDDDDDDDDDVGFTGVSSVSDSLDAFDSFQEASRRGGKSAFNAALYENILFRIVYDISDALGVELSAEDLYPFLKPKNGKIKWVKKTKSSGRDVNDVFDARRAVQADADEEFLVLVEAECDGRVTLELVVDDEVVWSDSANFAGCLARRVINVCR